MRNRWSNNPGGSCGLFLGIFFIAFSRLALAETAPRLSAFLNKEEIQVGEGVTLTVSVQWVGEASAFEFDLPPLPELHLLQAAGSSQKSAAYRQEGRLEQLHSFLFDLKAQKKGRAEIGAVLVKYRRPGEEEYRILRSEPRELTVVSRGAKYRSTFSKAAVITLLLAALAVLAALYIRWMINRYRRRTREMISDYVRDLEEESLNELGKARKLEVEGDREGFYRQIRGVLSTYLSRRFSFDISGKKKDQILKDPALSGLPEQSRRELAEIIEKLQEARFGGYPLSGEAPGALLKMVRGFIEARAGKD